MTATILVVVLIQKSKKTAITGCVTDEKDKRVYAPTVGNRPLHSSYERFYRDLSTVDKRRPLHQVLKGDLQPDPRALFILKFVDCGLSLSP